MTENQRGKFPEPVVSSLTLFYELVLINTYPSPQETKVGFLFGNFILKTGLCVGMKVNGHTEWLLLHKKQTSLMGIFAEKGFEKLSLGRSKWKSLINGSSMHVSGFL